MSQPPHHDQSEAPRPGSERRRLGTAPLPLSYNQDMGQSTMGRTAPDSSELVPPPEEPFIMPSGSNESARLFGNAPTLPGQGVWPIELQQTHQPWWVLWLLLTFALVVLVGLSPFLYAAIQQNSSPTSGSLIQHGTVTSSAIGNSPPATKTATVHPTATATQLPTATALPTATTVSGNGNISVSPLSIQQKCSVVLRLPSFYLTLSNQTGSSVSYQITVVTPMPGTTTPWASVNPASGSIPARTQQQVDVTPNAMLCTDRLLQGTKPFLLDVTATSGTSGNVTVTDLITSAL